ncbi:MAG: hypothetical protein ACXVCP_02310 [Bdellovibrio sp.]
MYRNVLQYPMTVHGPRNMTNLQTGEAGEYFVEFFGGWQPFRFIALYRRAL